MKPKFLLCRVMEEEFRALLPPDTDIESFDISLHTRPERLRAALQEAIDRADGQFDPIVLGYGLCSQAVVGLRAAHAHLAVFRVDDCIAVFLGSSGERRRLALEQPGSYFLSRGWIGENTGSVFDEYDHMCQRFGRERADRLFPKLLGHYTHLVHLIQPQAPSLEADRQFARDKAALCHLEYREIAGSSALIEPMARLESSADILIVPPGEPITLEQMMAKQG